jgi:hypothetical protein
MLERKLTDRKGRFEGSSASLAPQVSRAIPPDTPRKGYRAWLFGAYTFLVVWGTAYLVLLFTDRLPH